mmetsp:Transcript_19314/g.37935  ORF Transcript_19314/g.37935 Transcript_19314/m.37935 type:complete len:88 (+) Transcript_19314:74-337(+)
MMITTTNQQREGRRPKQQQQADVNTKIHITPSKCLTCTSQSPPYPVGTHPLRLKSPAVLICGSLAPLEGGGVPSRRRPLEPGFVVAA